MKNENRKRKAVKPVVISVTAFVLVCAFALGGFALYKNRTGQSVAEETASEQIVSVVSEVSVVVSDSTAYVESVCTDYEEAVKILTKSDENESADPQSVQPQAAVETAEQTYYNEYDYQYKDESYYGDGQYYYEDDADLQYDGEDEEETSVPSDLYDWHPVRPGDPEYVEICKPREGYENDPDAIALAEALNRAYNYCRPYTGPQ